MARLSQRRALGILFALLGTGFAGVALVAAKHRVWVVAFAAGAIGLWFGSQSWALLRPR